MAERNTPQQGTDPLLYHVDVPVAAATLVEAGNIGVINASGYAQHGAVATTLKAVGRVEQTVDNSAGANGDKKVRIKRGTFKWNNSSAGDLIAQADLYATAYIAGPNTVAKTNGGNTRSAAGRIVGIDSDGVWVESY